MGLGSVSELIEYLNLHRHIFEKERSNKQHMERIMSMLSQENMEILEREFELYPKGLELPTFLYLMKKLYCPQNEISKYYFVSDLIKFFQAIDVNGDGHLEWSEFTEYIIENIRRIDRPNYKNKAFQENEVISSAYSKISNEYKIQNVIDTGSTNCIKKVLYVPREQKYYLLEAGSNLLRIFDAHFTLLDYLELKGESPHSFIVDFSFDKTAMIFCAIFEASARFCNLKVLGSVKSCNECEVKKMGNYHKVQFLPLHGYWAFLSKHGEVKLCTASYRSRTALDFTVVVVLRQHEALVTDVCQVEEPRYIVTSSMDGSIKYYSDYLKKSVAVEQGCEQGTSAVNSKHKKGVLGIDYTRQFGSYLLSYGFSSAILVYSLDVSLVKGFAGKYKEHGGNLLSARFLRSFPYVLSFDDKLNMRIWDFRRFQTMQIINCEKNFISPSRLELIPELSECLVCQKKITQFRAPSLEKKSRELNEFHVVFDFRVCALSNSLYLFTSNDVRVYNCVTGTLEKVFTRLHENTHDTNITACEFGYKGRKFFVGDAAGFVREYCSETGEFLQQVSPGEDNQYENKAIVRIIFLREHSLLIVCTLDGRVLIYERNDESQFELIRDMRETHFQLTCAEASARYCTLATGSEDGGVNIWSLEKLALEGVLALPSKVLHIAFSPIHPIMFVVEETGIISGFFVRPHQDSSQRNRCFVRLVNTESGALRRIASIHFQLVISAYLRRGSAVRSGEEEHHLLCTFGSEDGHLRVLNLTTLLTRFSIEQNHQIFSVKKSIKSEVHSLKATIAHERKKVLVAGFSNVGAPELVLGEFPGVGFQAHKERVQRVLLVKESSLILSSGGDKKVKLWSMEGQLNGAIDFFTFKKTSWRVAEMNFYKKLQAIDTTIYSMKLIENKCLSPEEEEFIRVNLLINEYMNEQEKEEYFRWATVLKRRRNRKQVTKPQHQPQKLQRSSGNSDFDARDEIAKFDNLNNLQRSTPLPQQPPEEENVEFYQIYSKLVNRIKTRLERPQFPVIEGRKEGITEQPEKEKEVTLGDFISTLRRTLKTSQQEEKKYQKQFALVMGKKAKPKKKPNNMLYQSLVEVRKNIQAMEKKQTKNRKLL